MRFFGPLIEEPIEEQPEEQKVYIPHQDKNIFKQFIPVQTFFYLIIVGGIILLTKFNVLGRVIAFFD
jgi:hypothetical protein